MEEFTHEGVAWAAYRDGANGAAGAMYFHRKDTGKSQWMDPRAAGASAKAKGKPVEWSGQSTMVVVATLVLTVSGFAGRIYYLAKYYPEMLFPTKKRKERKKGWARSKLKQSGKMSQDGKGGRSANS